MDLVKQKIVQAVDILNELDLDLWLIFCRETDVMADPCLPLVVGHKVVWQSAFFIGRDGDTTAMIGSYDTSDFEKSQRFKYVMPYVQDCGVQIREYIEKLNPGTIALNYSIDDPSADGLAHGMYNLLCDYLKGTPLAQRFVSAENLVSLLRGRKLDEELDRITSAAILANNAWFNALDDIEVGLTEIEIAETIEKHVARLGAKKSFEILVNAADKSDAGHGTPGTAKLAPGDLLHIDMGARLHEDLFRYTAPCVLPPFRRKRRSGRTDRCLQCRSRYNNRSRSVVPSGRDRPRDRRRRASASAGTRLSGV